MFLFAACVFFVAAPVLCAQQDQNQSAAPIPAYRPPLGGLGGGDADAGENSNQAAPQYQSLSGVQNLSLGEQATRSYWQPRFDVSGSADSNPQETGHGQNWGTWTSGSGGVEIHRVAGSSNMVLSYTAGGMYSDQDSGVGNGVVQGLSFNDKFTFRRSILTILDQSNYLPESSFGFGGLGLEPVSGVTAPGSAFNPGQAVLTGRGKILNNSNTIELDQLLTRRSSLTFSGGYSLLHYFDSDLLNYGTVNARAGYNYQVTQRDSLAVSYTFGDYRYSNLDESFSEHTLQLSFGRVVSGKLAFQIAAGPQVVVSQFATTLMGTSVSGTNSATRTQLLWSLNTALQYQQHRNGLALSYSHGVGGGSGVLIGAEMDTISGSVTRQMSRTFSSGLTGGYSRTQGLPGSGAQANEDYDYWFAGVNLTEPLSASVALTLSYQAQYQTSNAVACVGPTCGTNILRHVISVGLGWHERPLLF
jgi:hypothetical protein